VDDHAVIPKSGPSHELAAIAPAGMSLLSAVRGQPASQVRALVADLKADLEAFLEREPANYEALVLLGELKLRVGLCHEAQALLYRASMLQPPSWEAFQRTSLMLRRAEEQCRKAFYRLPGIPPPSFLCNVASKVADKVAPAVHRLMTRRSEEACA
jgi:hypothetical protein